MASVSLPGNSPPQAHVERMTPGKDVALLRRKTDLTSDLPDVLGNESMKQVHGDGVHRNLREADDSCNSQERAGVFLSDGSA